MILPTNAKRNAERGMQKCGNRIPASTNNRGKIEYQTSVKDVNIRLDLSALRFCGHGEKAFFDIWMFDLIAQSHFNQSLQAAPLKQEKEKTQYEEQVIHVKHALFTHLLFTIADGKGKASQ